MSNKFPPIPDIQNGEEGLKVREKLNAVIDQTNKQWDLDSKFGSHSANKSNPHSVKAPQVNLEPNSAALGYNVQQSLEMMLARYQKLAQDLVLTNVDGNKTVIQIRRGPHASTPPTPDQIDVGELSFDYDDGLVFSKLSDGTVVVVGGPQNISDAPKDSYLYGRMDGVWTRITPTLISDDPPSNVDNGTLWFDTGTTAELYVYDGAWVSVTGGNGGFGENGDIPDNIVLDEASSPLKNVALAREIDDNGDGVWRQITTSDLVTENAQPIFRDSSGRFSSSDEGVVRNQQQANWYLRDRIVEGVEKQAELEDKVKALEGAVGEHSLIFNASNNSPRPGDFNIKDRMNQVVNDLSEAQFIHISDEDRNGGIIAIERITDGDVMRLADIGGVTSELKIISVVSAGLFEIEKLFGDLDRLVEYPYDFNLFSSFDPQGLATINYVDGQDDKKLNKSGGTIAGTLDIKAARGASAQNSFRIAGRVNGKESVLLKDYQRKDTDDKNSDYIQYYGASPSDTCIMNKGQIIRLIDNETRARVTTWKYVDSSQPGDGEFSFKEQNGHVTLIIGNRTSDDILWVHGHGREEYITFDDSFFVSVTQSDGNFNLISDASAFEFSRKNKSHTHVVLDDAEWEVGLVEGRRYCIRIPGLLPIVKF